MTFYRFRSVSAALLFAVMAFSVLAYGAVETWSEMALEVCVFSSALVWSIWILKRRERFSLHGLTALPALIALAAALQIVFGWTANPYRTAHDGLLWLAYSAFFALCCDIFRDQSIRARFARMRVWFGFAVTTIALLQFYLSPEAIYGIREAPGGNPFGPFVDRNHYAIFVELILPWALVLAFRSNEKKFFYFVFCGLMIASVFVSGSRAGMAIVLGEFVVVVAARLFWRERSADRGGAGLVPRLIGPAMLILLLGLSVVSSSVLRRFAPDELERGLSRLEVGATAWKMFADKPLTGFGLGTFDVVYPSYAERYDGFRWHHAHSDSAELAMELGVVGIIVPLLLFGWALSRVHGRDVWLGLLLPLVAAWGHSWVEFPLRMPSLVLVGLTLLAQAATSSGIRIARRSKDAGLAEPRPPRETLVRS